MQKPDNFSLYNFSMQNPDINSLYHFLLQKPDSRLGKNPKSRGSLDRLSSKLSARFWKLSASTYPPARRAGSPWGPRQEFFWFLNLSRCIYRPLFNDFFILFLFYSIFIFILAAILFKIYTTPWTGGMGIAQTRRIEIPNSVGTF